MSPDHESYVPPLLLGLMIDHAHGRIAYARGACANSDRTGVLHALHQLKGMCAHTRDDRLTERIHQLEDAVIGCGDIPHIKGVLDHQLPQVEAALRALDPRGDAVHVLPLDDIVERVVAETRRVAARRGVHLTLGVPPPTDALVAARSGMVLLDHLGHLVRNAVAHGAASGSVTVKMVLRVDPTDGLTWIVANQGAVETAGAVDIDAGRGVALAAVAADLARIGGRLEHGPVDGGYQASIHLPADALRPVDVGPA